jgi:hypothetical protein
MAGGSPPVCAFAPTSGRVDPGSGRWPSLLVAVLIFLVTGPVVGAQPAPLNVQPMAGEFDAVPVHTVRDLALEATNPGAAALTVTVVDVAGNGFSLTADGCSGVVLDPEEACRVRVAFRPEVLGPAEGVVRFDTDRGRATVALRGTGVATAAPPTPTTTTTSPTTTEPGTTQTGPDPEPTDGPTTTSTTEIPETTAPLTSLISDEAAFERCRQRGSQAEVEYPTQLSMTVDEPTTVQVTARERNPATTMTTAPAAPFTTVEPAEFRCEVRARLLGPSHFDVTPEGFQESSFLDQPIIDWHWIVIPARAGAWTLRLQIESMLDGIVASSRGFTSDISVVAEPQTAWSRVDTWAEAVVDHPLIRGSASLVVVGGLVTGAWKLVQRRRRPAVAPKRCDHPRHRPRLARRRH